ncbi:MAG: ferrochelatase [Chloroflexi bacterium]|nr:ferrochelatase [Chloroflexota bacterium]
MIQVVEAYDAILLISFGGPEGPEDIMPFLDHVLRRRQVPEERKQEVAHHYELFGGVSPINAQNRALIAALREELRAAGIVLPVYWGNRNWHPFLIDTLREMQVAGIRRALGFVTSAFGSYSGCRQYLEDIEEARLKLGGQAPVVDKIRIFYNHPLFMSANAQQLRDTLIQVPAEAQRDARIVFTAHSIPVSAAHSSRYVEQLEETCRCVAEEAGLARWNLAYQSRSGPPQQPWLEPDVLSVLTDLHREGITHVVVMPIGFVADHIEVQYDLGIEARALAAKLGLEFFLAPTVGTHPLYVHMIRELIQERLNPDLPRRAVGRWGPSMDICPVDCCLLRNHRYRGS